jgi:5,10-methylenetetrahydromethanopterin reductase
LAIHDRHLIGPNELDRELVTGELLTHLGLARTADGQRARLAELEQAGVTGVIYQPAGPDIPRELGAFAEMAGLKAVD